MSSDAPPELIIDKQSLVLPPLTLGLTVAVAVCGVLSLVFSNASVLSYLVLHPLSLLPPKFWATTLITYPFVDLSVVNLVISLVSFPVFGKVLENLYGSAALAKYLFVSVFVTGAMLVAIGMFEPLLVRDVAYWSRIPDSAYFGFQGVLMACFVAMKQAMPETQMAIVFLFKLRLKTLPLFALGMTTLVCIVSPSRGAASMFVSLIVSWLYLRYFSTMYNGNSVRGDLRDSFSLASWFPPQMQGLVMPISSWLDARRCWPAKSDAMLPISTSGADVDNLAAESMPGSSSARDNRAVATELINERLQSIEKSRHSPSETKVDFASSSSTLLNDTFEPITPAKKLDFATD